MAKEVKFVSATLSGEGVLDVTPQETQQRAGEARIIDVRRPDEYVGELGHIQGAALMTLETELAKCLEALPKDDTYVFVCKAGGRSAHATAIARQKGFGHVYNMAGGMLAWNRLGLPTEK